jgi:DNA-binding HxlR family transcriptional regulator
MGNRRTYGDRCGIARALDLVGERWALLVVRDLLLGPKRFTDLRAGLPNVSADVLSQRLRELEESGIVRRRKLDPPAGSRVYELTDWGLDLEPVVLALGRWGSRATFPPGEAQFGPDSAILALKTVFDPSNADGYSATYELRLDGQRFHIAVSDGRLDASRGAAERPDATLSTDPATLAEVLWHGHRLADAEASGALKIEGSRTAARRFLKLFPPPQPT